MKSLIKDSLIKEHTRNTFTLIAVSLLVALLVISLTSCGEEDNPTDPSGGGDDSQTDTDVTYADEADFSFSNGIITDYSGSGGVVNIPATIGGVAVTSIGEKAFYECSSLTSVSIPDSVTSIGERAFYSCDSLTSVTIGKSVTSIGKKSFVHCDSLTSVTIPDSVTSIGSYAFYRCDSLTSVTIGKSVTIIGDGAFDSCTSLKSVYIDATSPPDLEFGYYGWPFSDNASGRKFYVPAGSVTTYKNHSVWDYYDDDILSQ